MSPPFNSKQTSTLKVLNFLSLKLEHLSISCISYSETQLQTFRQFYNIEKAMVASYNLTKSAAQTDTLLWVFRPTRTASPTGSESLVFVHCCL